MGRGVISQNSNLCLAAKLESRKQSEEPKSTNPLKADGMSGKWRTVCNALGVVNCYTQM